MSDDWIVAIPDRMQRLKAVNGLRATVECGLADRDERDIEEHIGALAMALFDEDTEVRAASCETLHSALHDGQTVQPAYPAIRRILSDRTHDLRVQASMFLADAASTQEHIEECVSLLHALLDDEDRQVKQNSIRALVLELLRVRQWDGITPLLQHADDLVREQALRALDPARGVRHFYWDLIPLIPALVERLTDCNEAVRFAAAGVVARVDRKGNHFPTTSRILAEHLGHQQVSVRGEAASAMNEAVDNLLLSHRRMSKRRAQSLLGPLETRLMERLGDERKIRWLCIEALARILLATRQQDRIEALLDSMEPTSAALLMCAIGTRTNPGGETVRACLGPSGLAWKVMEPLVEGLGRHASRKDKGLSAAATSTLAHIHIHTSRWDAFADLFKRAPLEIRCSLLDDLSHCQSRACGAIDALVPMLLQYTIHRQKKLADTALQRLIRFVAPGAYMLPWRGDLSYEEQNRRAQIVLDAIQATGLSPDGAIWDLMKHSRSVLHAREVAGLSRKLERLTGEARVERLRQVLQDDGSALTEREHKKGDLAQTGTPEREVPSPQDARAEVVTWAAHELGVLALTGEADICLAIPALTRCLEHEDMFVRAEGAEALGQAAAKGFSSEEVIGDLVRGLESDPIAKVRAIMARALGMAAEKGLFLTLTAPALARGLSDEHPTVRWWCRIGLLGTAFSADRARIILDALAVLALPENEEIVEVRQRCEHRLK